MTPLACLLPCRFSCRVCRSVVQAEEAVCRQHRSKHADRWPERTARGLNTAEFFSRCEAIRAVLPVEAHTWRMHFVRCAAERSAGAVATAHCQLPKSSESLHSGLLNNPTEARAAGVEVVAFITAG